MSTNNYIWNYNEKNKLNYLKGTGNITRFDDLEEV